MQALRERRSHRPSVVSPAQGSAQFNLKHVAAQLAKGRSPFNWSRLLCGLAAAFNGILFIYNYLTLSKIRSSSFPPATASQSPPPITWNHHGVYDYFVTIYAYDRPRHLLNLLRDIAREADMASLSVGVNVIDDNSYACTFPPVSRNIYNTKDSFVQNDGNDTLYEVPLPASLTSCVASHRFRFVEQFLHTRRWRLFISPYRHGRRRYWHLIRHAHTLLKPVNSRFYLFLPDDDRLPFNFFPSVFSAWDSIHDPRKLTLMLHVEKSREHVAVWTDFIPQSMGPHTNITRIGWVESGNFICSRDFLEFFNWTFPSISPRRWIDNPPISSGVGATMSQLIHDARYKMYRTNFSFVAHVGITLSKMNAAFRDPRIPALRTMYFADGESRYEALLNEAHTVTCSVASHWLRDATLHAAVYSLAHQVDHLNVYLNGYDDTVIPHYLQAPFITVVHSQSAGGDIGDVGKFFWANKITTDWHATVDDDIVYPEDYIDRLLRFRKSFRQSKRVVVGVHGIQIKEDWLRPASGTGRRVHGRGYYGSREVWMATENVSEAVNVHIIGTGTMLYKPSEIGVIDLSQVFPKPNMADIWFALLMQRLGIPMMVVPHEAGWITEVDGTFDDSIYKRASSRRSAEREQTQAALSIPKWRLFHTS